MINAVCHECSWQFWANIELIRSINTRTIFNISLEFTGCQSKQEICFKNDKIRSGQTHSLEQTYFLQLTPLFSCTLSLEGFNKMTNVFLRISFVLFIVHLVFSTVMLSFVLANLLLILSP